MAPRRSERSVAAAVTLLATSIGITFGTDANAENAFEQLDKGLQKNTSSHKVLPNKYIKVEDTLLPAVQNKAEVHQQKVLPNQYIKVEDTLLPAVQNKINAQQQKVLPNQYIKVEDTLLPAVQNKTGSHQHKVLPNKYIKIGGKSPSLPAVQNKLQDYQTGDSADGVQVHGWDAVQKKEILGEGDR